MRIFSPFKSVFFLVLMAGPILITQGCTEPEVNQTTSLHKVAIEADGQLLLNNHAVTLADLEKSFVEIANQKDLIVELKVASEAPMGTVNNVMQAMRNAPVARISQTMGDEGNWPDNGMEFHPLVQ